MAEKRVQVLQRQFLDFWLSIPPNPFKIIPVEHYGKLPGDPKEVCKLLLAYLKIEGEPIGCETGYGLEDARGEWSAVITYQEPGEARIPSRFGTLVASLLHERLRAERAPGQRRPKR